VTLFDARRPSSTRKEPSVLRGLTTVNFYADDLDAARRWYAEALGVEPYFAREVEGKTAYVEFRIGDYEHELGLIDARFAPHRSSQPAGALTYWHVDDVEATFERLLSLGATAHEKVTERGPGFVTASVVDPFGNILGVMYNQHYLDVLAHVARV
jgi:predicted enzyme related to lactoylglutathione lyase